MLLLLSPLVVTCESLAGQGRKLRVGLTVLSFLLRRSQFPVHGWEGGQSEKTDGTYGTHATYGNLIHQGTA